MGKSGVLEHKSDRNSEKLLWRALAGTGDVILVHGRPRARWTDQLRNDTGSAPANLWRRTILYGAMVERRDGPSWLHDDDDDMARRNEYHNK